MIDGFNKIFSNIAASYLKFRDKSMTEIQFFTNSKGGLPLFSYIFRKPETLGIELDTVVCSVTGYLVFLLIQHGKEEIKLI